MATWRETRAQKKGDRSAGHFSWGDEVNVATAAVYALQERLGAARSKNLNQTVQVKPTGAVPTLLTPWCRGNVTVTRHEIFEITVKAAWFPPRSDAAHGLLLRMLIMRYQALATDL